jgi:hypothetical protein
MEKENAIPYKEPNRKEEEEENKKKKIIMCNDMSNTNNDCNNHPLIKQFVNNYSS